MFEDGAALDSPWTQSPPGPPAIGLESLQTRNYSVVLLIQLSLLLFDLLVNSFSELLRAEPAIQLILFMWVSSQSEKYPKPIWILKEIQTLVQEQCFVFAAHTRSLLSQSMQDTAILLNLIIILLMLSSTFVFQVGLVAILLERFRALLMLSALYLTFSVILHSWLVVGAARTYIFLK